MVYHSQDLSKYSFLVTGGCGFIGCHVVKYLHTHKAGKITVLDDFSTSTATNIQLIQSLTSVTLLNTDIRSIESCMEACQNIDYVIHLAALGSVTRSVDNPIATHLVNTEGFINILWAGKQRGVKRIVYASSSSVYGDSTDSPKKESKTGHPLSPYALTKQINEQYASLFSRIYNSELIGLRFFNVFGPRQNPQGAYAALIPLAIRALNTMQPLTIYGDGLQTRDFTYVENVVQCILKAIFASNNCIGQVYNVAYGKNTSVAQVLGIIQNIANNSIDIKYAPKRPGDVGHSLADISLARAQLNYFPQIDIEEGLRNTYEYYKTVI